MEPCEDLVLEIAHGGLALGLVVIVAHQVESAMDGEQRHFLGHAPVPLRRLADGLVEINDHVAQNEWRRSAEARRLVREVGATALHRPFVQRERQDVGWPAFTHVVEVQVGHLRIAGDRQLHLGLAPGQCHAHGFGHRRRPQLLGRVRVHRLDDLGQPLAADLVMERDPGFHGPILGHPSGPRSRWRVRLGGYALRVSRSMGRTFSGYVIRW